MDFRKVKQLINLIEKHDLSEIEIRENDESVIIRNQNHAAFEELQYSECVDKTVHDLDVELAPKAVTKHLIVNTENNISGFLVKSLMVGTFYHSAAPHEMPFVQLGDDVEIGDTLCIIEVVGSMNTISAERAGKITQIFVHNAQCVEFGQPLFIIE